MLKDTHFTNNARVRLDQVLNRAYLISSWYGQHAEDAYMANWGYTFTRFLQVVDHIATDGNDSFIGHQADTGFTVGLIFTREDPATTLKKHTKATDVNEVQVTDDWPRSGSWSLHSVIVAIILIALLCGVALSLHYQIEDGHDEYLESVRSRNRIKRELDHINSVTPDHYVGDSNFWYLRWKDEE